MSVSVVDAEDVESTSGTAHDVVLQIPSSWQARSDVESVHIRAHPLTNSNQYAQHCWRCAAAIPLLATNDACPTCGSAIVRSFVTFEPLPVIEFELADGISDDEAARWLAAEPRWHESRHVDIPI